MATVVFVVAVAVSSLGPSKTRGAGLHGTAGLTYFVSDMNLMSNESPKGRNGWLHITRALLLLLMWTGRGHAHSAHAHLDCKSSTTVAEIIKDTYKRHVDYIRIGVTSDLVNEFYNFALLNLAEAACVCGKDSVAQACVNVHFFNEIEYVSLDLWWVVSDDRTKPSSQRLFPDLLEWSVLPAHLDELEKKEVEKLEHETYLEFSAEVERKYSEVTSGKGKNNTGIGRQLVSLPSDEIVRFDPKREEACLELSQKVTQDSPTISARVLTSFVVGILNQVTLSKVFRDGMVNELISQQVRLVYNAARCRRATGQKLKVPIVYLDNLVTAVHLVLVNCSIQSSATVLGALPKLTEVDKLVRQSKRFFPRLVDRISGMGSSGLARYVTWTGSKLIVEPIWDTIKRNISLEEMGKFDQVFRDNQLEMIKRNGSCEVNFRFMPRLDDVKDNREMCCSDSCVRTRGNVIDLFVLNEMCCRACNGLWCNVGELIHVLHVHSEWATKHNMFTIGEVL